MKVSIVGAGNAGVFTALYYSWYGRRDDIEIELIHNPDIAPSKVGQSTIAETPQLLYHGTRFNYYDNHINATPKTGILYEGWGQLNDKFIHPFPANVLAMNFCPSEMQRHVINSGRFKVTESNVLDPNDIDADYVFDCRGRPKDLTDYYKLRSPVNSAILGKPQWDVTEDLWSRHVATPDGWAFVIPMRPQSPSHDGAVGYIYNNKITNTKDAEKNFGQIFDVEVMDHLSFDSYMAKSPIVNDRVILNGNRLFFLEPMEATAVEAYIEWSRHTFDAIVTKKHTLNDAASGYKRFLRKLQNFILWHYQSGSVYDTPFWKYATEYSHFNDPTFDKFVEAGTKLSWDSESMNEFRDVSYTGIKLRYAVWPLMSFKNWIEGITLNRTAT